MNLLQHLLLPLTGALAGWLTASLLSVLIFHPRQPFRIFGLKLQGLLPAHRQQLSASLAKAVAQALPLEKMTERLNRPEAIAAVLPGIEAHIDAFLKQRLSEKLPVLAMFLSDEILQTIKATLTEEIASLLPEVAGRFAEGLGNAAELERMIADRLAAMPPEQTEQALRGALAGALGKLRLFGLIAGFVAGLLMMLILWWI
jgi:uncharacterized membrane protein YheB (UPF0754 family)